MARKVAQRTAKTARRGYGEGSLYQETVRAPDGSVTYRWVAAFERGRDPITGKHLSPKRCRAATKAEAIAKRETARRRWQEGRSTDKPTKVDELVGTWLGDVISKKPSPNTRDNYAYYARFIREHLGHMTVEGVRVVDVNRMLESLANKGYAKSTVARAQDCTEALFKYALALDLDVRTNPGAVATMPRCVESKEREAFTLEQVNALLTAAPTHRLGALVVLGLYTGMRPAELTGIAWSHLELDSGAPTAHVVQTIKKQGAAELFCGPVKRSTAADGRLIELPPRVTTALRDHRERQLEEATSCAEYWGAGTCPEPSEPREKKGCGRTWAQHQLVFTSRNGNALDPSNVRKAFRIIVERAGLDPSRAVPYLMRHTAGSLLIDNGATVEQVADLFGDKAQTVYRHYRRPTKRVSTVAADRMGQILANG